MKDRYILAIDVDLTLVDTLTPWLDWFHARTGIEFDPKSSAFQYDLVPVMRDLMAKHDIMDFDPFDYWRRSDLYDNLAPIEGAVEVLRDIKYEHPFNVQFVVVSHCVPEHETSKRLFCKRYLPEHAFISTSDKGLVNYNKIVDDNPKVIKQAMAFQPSHKHIHFTQFCFEKELHDVQIARNWEQVGEILEKEIPLYFSEKQR